MKKMKIDLTGQIFGRLTVIKDAGRSKNNHVKWLCECLCGNEATVLSYDLRSQKVRSCSCLQKELARNRVMTHKMSNTPTYSSWMAMKMRCLNHKHVGYEDYGGRGIKICDRWMNFENFYKDMGDRPKGLSLERIDNNGNYEPENCRWATTVEQANNRRKNIFLTYRRKKYTMAEWSRLLNMNYTTIQGRLRLGWSLEKAFNPKKFINQYA